MTKLVTIIITATHDESSDTHLAALLAKFTSDLHNTGYAVLDIVCEDGLFVLPEEEPKSEERATPIPPPEIEGSPVGALAMEHEFAVAAEEEEDEAVEEEEAAAVEEESVDEVEPVDEEDQGDEGEAPPKPKSKELIDPGDYTVAQLRLDNVLDDYIRRQLNSLHAREMKGKARDGAVAAIKDAIDALGGP